MLARQIRYTEIREKEGWYWESTHVWLGCPVCTGRMEQLTCNGRPVPLPKDPINNFEITTPVGIAMYWDAEVGYRPYHLGKFDLPVSEAEILPEEIGRGYYDIRDRYASSHPDAVRIQDAADGRKVGTPKHWCLGLSDKHERWLDPEMIDDLEW